MAKSGRVKKTEARRASHQARSSKRGEPPPGASASRSMRFGDVLKQARAKKGVSQAELAAQSGVSPRTIVKIEQSSGARSDAIVRLAHALGQPVETWLRLAGHGALSPEKIAAIINQQRSHESGFLTHLERDPIEFLTELRAQIQARNAPALMCASFTSKPAAISRSDFRQAVLQLLEAGMHLALVCPYPHPADIPPEYHTSKPWLVGLYSQVFNWVRQLAGDLCRALPDRQQQVGVFVPSSQRASGSARPIALVPPPLRITEYRPALIKLAPSSSGEPEKIELGAYMRFGGNRPDRWLALSPRTGPQGEEQERAEECMNTWKDYFGDILGTWHPEKTEKPWSGDKLTDWRLVDLR